MRPTQYFLKEYRERCSARTPGQILAFLEDFRLLHSHQVKPKIRLISIKIPEPLLAAFREKCKQAAVPYQTQIKIIMDKWL